MHHSRSLILAATVASLALSACAGPKDMSNQGAAGDFDPAHCQGGTLKVLNSSDLGDFDPAQIYTSGGGAIPSLVYRTLTTRNRAPGEAGQKVVPDLATNVGEPSDNARTWTYHLKPNLKFEDGSPITAQDVKYGIERSFSPDLTGGAPYLHDWLVGGESYQGPYDKNADLKSIETPDDSTIVFHLKEPHGDFPYLATATQVSPVPQDKDTGVNYVKHPISSGPYMVKSYDPSSSMVLVRNKYWSRKVDHERLACPDQIDISLNLDPATVNERLQQSSGDDQYAITTDTPVGPAQLAELSSDDALKDRTITGQFGETMYIAFNTKVKPFDNLKVRQAFNYLVNRRTAVDADGGTSLADPATTVLPNQPVFGYSPYDAYPAGPSGNPSKAKELMSQAGVKPGQPFTLVYSTDDPKYAKIASAFQEAAKRAGVTVNLNGLSGDAYSSQAFTPSKEPGMVLMYWGADWPSGGPFLQPLFDGRQILSGGNYNLTQLDDPKINAQFDDASTKTDPAEAAKIYGDIDKEVLDAGYTVPLLHGKSIVLFGAGVKNTYVDEWRGWYDIAMVSVK